MQRSIEQALRNIPSEPYSDLRPVLAQFIESVQSALEEDFVGAYAVGSLATGDFDLDSDIDFLIVIREELTDAEVALLRALHLEIHKLDCYPAKHLEGSYISRQCLTCAELVGVQPLWYVDDGSSVLEQSVHDNQWHVRWILRECGITLVGPEPKELMEPVPVEALRGEMVSAIERLRMHFVSEIDKPLGWFNTRFGQSFTVLTCCRMLHTVRTGVIQSKLAAVQWAEESIDVEWCELVKQAWAERTGARYGTKVRQPAEVGLLHQTGRFIGYVQNELRPRQ